MKLESYIRNNRQKLDVEKPDEDHIWARVSLSLNKKGRRKSIVYWKYVVTIAASVFITFFACYQMMKQPDQQLVFVHTDPNLAKYEAEMVNKIKHYALRIERANYNLSELPTTPDILQDIDLMIEMYSADLKESGPNQALIQSLIDLYEKKVSLLQRILTEIEKTKDYETPQILL
jgi:hypothetical protein